MDGGSLASALKILRMYRETGTEGWDLHAFFELTAGDDQQRRTEVLDIVDRLVELGCLESRGSDFYTLTETGRAAAQSGRIEGFDRAE